MRRPSEGGANARREDDVARRGETSFAPPLTDWVGPHQYGLKPRHFRVSPSVPSPRTLSLSKGEGEGESLPRT